MLNLKLSFQARKHLQAKKIIVKFMTSFHGVVGDSANPMIQPGK